MPQRVALVTGANRGLGFETARQLVAKGLDVVVTSRREDMALAAARQLGARAQVLDVTDARSVQRAAELVGPVDVLVNNAAISLDEGGVLAVEDPELFATLQTNVAGAWRVARAFAPGMSERGWGRIVNVSSGAGAMSDLGGYAPAYAVSKAALNAFTRLLAQELRDTGVKVNSVCPGWVRTDMGGPQARRTVQAGARGIVWAAMLPDHGPTDGFFRDGKPIPW